MKKILKYITTNWVLLIITGLGLYFVASGAVSGCKQKHTEQIIASVNTSVIRNKIIDSITSSNSKKEIAKIDSLNKSHAQKEGSLKKEIRSLKANAGRQVSAYEKDTTAQSPACDSLINTFTLLTDSLTEAVNQADSINTNLNTKINILEADKEKQSASLKTAYDNIDLQSKELKKYTSPGAKRKKWIDRAAGFLIGFLVFR